MPPVDLQELHRLGLQKHHKELTLQYWESERPGILQFCNYTIAEMEKAEKDKRFHASINALPKTGKLGMMQLFSILLREDKIKHYYISSFRRKDNQIQLNGNGTIPGLVLFYGHTHVFAFNTVAESENAYEMIARDICNGCTIYVHFDESDYGTAQNKQDYKPSKYQAIAKKLVKLSDGNNGRVKILHYSATNEELNFSEFIDRCVEVHFDDEHGLPIEHIGPNDLLASGRCRESTPFFSMGSEPPCLTQQGRECLNSFSDKLFVGGVRFVSGLTPTMEIMFRYIINEYYPDVYCHFISEKSSFNHSMSPTESWDGIRNLASIQGEARNAGKKYILLVFKHTCTRSVEVEYHNHLAFWHEHPGKKVAYGTILQRIGRMFYYAVKHKDGRDYTNCQFKLYTSLQVLRLAAGEIDNETFTDGVAGDDREYILGARIGSAPKNKYRSSSILYLRKSLKGKLPHIPQASSFLKIEYVDDKKFDKMSVAKQYLPTINHQKRSFKFTNKVKAAYHKNGLKHFEGGKDTTGRATCRLRDIGDYKSFNSFWGGKTSTKDASSGAEYDANYLINEKGQCWGVNRFVKMIEINATAKTLNSSVLQNLGD